MSEEYDTDLKPWQEGYLPPAEAYKRSPAEIGRLGGLKSQARRKAGLPPLPTTNGTGKPGRKLTSEKAIARAERATEENLPLKKRMFLDRFVAEYIHDFNSSMAYIRAGGVANHATTGGPEALRTAYVQNQIRILTEHLEEEKLVTRGEVLMGIKKEANHHGEDGSSSARVRAWGLLAKIKGMEAPTKVEAEVVHKGGVMEVPMVATEVEWQDVASQSQTQLKNDVRT